MRCPPGPGCGCTPAAVRPAAPLQLAGTDVGAAPTRPGRKPAGGCWAAAAGPGGCCAAAMRPAGCCKPVPAARLPLLGPRRRHPPIPLQLFRPPRRRPPLELQQRCRPQPGSTRGAQRGEGGPPARCIAGDLQSKILACPSLKQRTGDVSRPLPHVCLHVCLHVSKQRTKAW